jgi:hypothetical protein
VSVRWASPSSRGLWGGDALLLSPPANDDAADLRDCWGVGRTRLRRKNCCPSATRSHCNHAGTVVTSARNATAAASPAAAAACTLGRNGEHGRELLAAERISEALLPFRDSSDSHHPLRGS